MIRKPIHKLICKVTSLVVAPVAVAVAAFSLLGCTHSPPSPSASASAPARVIPNQTVPSTPIVTSTEEAAVAVAATKLDAASATPSDASAISRPAAPVDPSETDARGIPRRPASVTDISAFATSQEIEQTLRQVSDVTEFKYHVSQFIRYYVIIGAHTEKIVASFDEKIKEGLVGKSGDPAALKTELREMDCQLTELQSMSGEIQEKIETIYKLVLERSDEGLLSWFIERLAVAPGFDTTAQIFARYNYIRVVKTYNALNCKTGVCRAANFSRERLRFPFDSASDAEAFAYKKAHRGEVALFFANQITRVNSCLSRDPASAGSPKSTTGSAPGGTPGTNYFGGNLPSGTFSVTYDDGPHRSYTSKILGAWMQSGFPKPTFFWLAREAEKYPQIVKAVAASGAEIACHSYSHPDLGNISRAVTYGKLDRTNVMHFFPTGRPPEASFETWKEKTLDQEFNGAISIIEDILADPPASTQKKIAKFRLPYGSGFNNPVLLEMLKAKSLVHVHWMIDSLDWQDKNPLSVAERVKNQMVLHKKGIILFHDIHPQSFEATKLLIAYIKKQKAFRLAPLVEAL